LDLDYLMIGMDAVCCIFLPFLGMQYYVLQGNKEICIQYIFPVTAVKYRIVRFVLVFRLYTFDGDTCIVGNNQQRYLTITHCSCHCVFLQVCQIVSIQSAFKAMA